MTSMLWTSVVWWPEICIRGQILAECQSWCQTYHTSYNSQSRKTPDQYYYPVLAVFTLSVISLIVNLEVLLTFQSRLWLQWQSFFTFITVHYCCFFSGRCEHIYITTGTSCRWTALCCTATSWQWPCHISKARNLFTGWWTNVALLV